MKRRQILIGLIAAAYKAQSLARPTSLPCPVPPDVCRDDAFSYWSLRLLGQGWWKDLTVNVHAFSDERANPVDPEVPYAMRQHLLGRAEIVDIQYGDSWSPATTDDEGSPPVPADIDIGFYENFVDVAFAGASPIWIIAANGVIERATWKAAGMAYEEWVTRAWLGSWLNACPQHVDHGIVIADFSRSETHPSGPRGCAISMALVVGGILDVALNTAVHDVRESLESRSLTHFDSLLVTYHGTAESSCGFALFEACARVLSDDFCCTHAVDWDKGITQPFVSVIGSARSSGPSEAPLDSTSIQALNASPLGEIKVWRSGRRLTSRFG